MLDIQWTPDTPVLLVVALCLGAALLAAARYAQTQRRIRKRLD